MGIEISKNDINIFKPSRFLIRLLDRNKLIDYLFILIIGALPICVAYLIGAHKTIENYRGYLDFPNWWSLAFLLPLILFAFRWGLGKIAPVGSPQLTDDNPPIINILKDDTAKINIYDQLRQNILSKSNFLITFIIVAIVHILDMPKFLTPYFSGVSNGYYDWSTMFLLESSGVSKASNLILFITAGVAQFCAVFIGTLAIILFLRHNLFFMRHIYQRQHVQQSKSDENAESYFQIDVNDVNRCFGFRSANQAFNTQVKALMIAGAAMFLSRFAHASHDQSCVFDISNWQSVFSCLSFPLTSQWLMALFWLITLFIVSMPSFVKLLPRMPYRGSDRIDLSVENYLQEFFSDETWPKDKAGNDESIATVAGKFARNSFWPTGDNRAHTLFLFSYWIFFVILLPPVSFEIKTLLITFAVYGTAAYLLKNATFWTLKWALRYVDDMLVVERNELSEEIIESEEKSNVSVFISYRRSDSAPYARSIHKYLCDHFRKENIFMDIDSIEPGVKFGQEIEKALDKVDAVIALIGEEWMLMVDENGNPRIHNPEDMVQFEIATALKLEKRVFPVLVEKAEMPAEKDLPVTIKELAQINAVELSDHRWDYDMDLLMKALNSTN